VCVIEKEAKVAAHQSGRNSGVLHTGVYYEPGGIKARTCRAGFERMIAYARDRGVPLEICGKVIVAVEESELGRLAELQRRAIANGVRASRLDATELRDVEPHANGVAALHVPDAGIIDYRCVAEEFARDVVDGGGEILFSRQVIRIDESGAGWSVVTDDGSIVTPRVVNCAGLYSDRVARSAGIQPLGRIVPFRGEYYRVKPSGNHLCRGLIYPVPDPRFPFLGVHFTRTIDGEMTVGPNAVLALSREGYRWRDVRAADVWDALSYPGFLRLAGRHGRTGIGEVYRSWSKRAFVGALRRLVPDVEMAHLERAPAGVRAQFLRRDGSLETEFLILGSGGQAHVCNAPSPGATSSMAIAEYVVDQLFGERSS
jgi:L-2-hydroxyglutarate oxidase LhgO